MFEESYLNGKIVEFRYKKYHIDRVKEGRATNVLGPRPYGLNLLNKVGFQRVKQVAFLGVTSNMIKLHCLTIGFRLFPM